MVRISSSKVNSTYLIANNNRLSFRGMKTITVGCYRKAELMFSMYISDESFPFDSIYKIATYSISLFHLVSPRPALPRLHPPISRHWKMIPYLLFVLHIMSRTEIRYLLCGEREREWERWWRRRICQKVLSIKITISSGIMMLASLDFHRSCLAFMTNGDDFLSITHRSFHQNRAEQVKWMT